MKKETPANCPKCKIPFAVYMPPPFGDGGSCGREDIEDREDCGYYRYFNDDDADEVDF